MVMSSVSACTFLTPTLRLSLKKWGYVCMLLACCVQCPLMTGGSWLGRIRLRLSACCTGNSYSEVKENGYFEDFCRRCRATARRGNARSSNESPEIRQLYKRLSSLRHNFASTHAQSTRPYVETIRNGLYAVTRYLSLALREVEQYASTEAWSLAMAGSVQYRAIFPHGQPVALVSAAEGSACQYTLIEEKPFWVLVGPNGRRYHFRMWPLGRGKSLNNLLAMQAPEKIENIMTLPTIFHEDSLEAVEGKYRVLTFDDLLIHPNEQTRLSFPGGSALNFIVLYRPTMAILKKLADTIDLWGKTSPVNGEVAAIARLNLTLQLLLLVGRITLCHVVLGRFDITRIRVDKSGVLFLQPHPVPRREVSPPQSASDAYDSREVWREYDRRTNAKDAARILLYIWCPSTAKSVAAMMSTPTREQAMRAATHPHCSYIPDEVVQIIDDVFTEAADIGDVLFSASYTNLRVQLQNALEDQSRKRR